MKEILLNKLDMLSLAKFKNNAKIQQYKETIVELEKKILELRKKNNYIECEEDSLLDLLEDD